ncbi:MAG: sugar ABC transporter permease [Myxococcota bacterium]
MTAATPATSPAPWRDRRFAMLASLVALWWGFDWASDGIFLSPRNLVNLAVQTSAVGVMAMGMVFVIASRHIDLSVGSIVGFVGMTIGALQLGSWGGDPLPWPLALLLGIGLAGAIGAWHGWWVAHLGLPAFVVTLAGLLVFRGAAWLVSDGQTLAPLPEPYTRIGGGLHGVLPLGVSFFVAAVAGAVWVAVRSTRRRRTLALGEAALPLAWEVGIAIAGCGALLGFVALAGAVPVRGDAVAGVPYPVLLLGAVGVALHVLAVHTRFGRHLFAMGGQPRAAELAGIDVRGVTLRAFILMGVLAGLAAVLTTARLGAATNSMGTLSELAVIAAAVLGGTSLAGGTGSVAGAVLGALWMQSLDNGLLLLDVTSALRQVVIGLTLLLAVALDVRWRGTA